MRIARRRFLHLAIGAAALPAAPRLARAQAYPTRRVRLIVGAAAGGAPDILARLIGEWLSGRLGQTFVVENRPGAGGNVATEGVVKAPADGYTLLRCAETHRHGSQSRPVVVVRLRVLGAIGNPVARLDRRRARNARPRRAYLGADRRFGGAGWTPSAIVAALLDLILLGLFLIVEGPRDMGWRR